MPLFAGKFIGGSLITDEKLKLYTNPFVLALILTIIIILILILWFDGSNIISTAIGLFLVNWGIFFLNSYSHQRLTAKRGNGEYGQEVHNEETHMVYNTLGNYETHSDAKVNFGDKVNPVIVNTTELNNNRTNVIAPPVLPPEFGNYNE